MTQPPPPTDGDLVEDPPGSTIAPVPKAVLQALPPSPSRLLLVGADRRLGGELEGLGYSVAARLELDEDVAAALGQLDVDGSLVVLPQPGVVRLPEIEACLAEGHQLLRFEKQLEGGSRWLVTRRDPYVVRAYRPGDESQIVELFAGSFHHRRPLEHWRWEYRDHPLGGPFVSAAFDSGGRLVAHYAGYPARFRKASGEVLSAFQIGDTMTVPEVRHVGRGPTSLLARTGRHFYARCCTGRVAFNYGFNVGNIQKFSTLFLRAERVEPVPFRRLSGPALDRLRAPRRRWPWHRIRTEEVQKLDERWDELFDRVAPSYGLLAERRSKNLSWRYLERPGFDYRIHAAFRGRRLIAWGVFARREETLRWGDLLVDPAHPEALAEVLRSALGGEVGSGAQSVEAWLPDRPSWLRPGWSAMGFEALPEPQDLSLMCVPFTRQGVAAELRHDLFYTLGDSDLF